MIFCSFSVADDYLCTGTLLLYDLGYATNIESRINLVANSSVVGGLGVD